MLHHHCHSYFVAGYNYAVYITESVRYLDTSIWSSKEQNAPGSQCLARLLVGGSICSSGAEVAQTDHDERSKCKQQGIMMTVKTVVSHEAAPWGRVREGDSQLTIKMSRETDPRLFHLLTVRLRAIGTPRCCWCCYCKTLQIVVLAASTTDPGAKVFIASSAPRKVYKNRGRSFINKFVIPDLGQA